MSRAFYGWWFVWSLSCGRGGTPLLCCQYFETGYWMVIITYVMFNFCCAWNKALAWAICSVPVLDTATDLHIRPYHPSAVAWPYWQCNKYTILVRIGGRRLLWPASTCVGNLLRYPGMDSAVVAFFKAFLDLISRDGELLNSRACDLHLMQWAANGVVSSSLKICHSAFVDICALFRAFRAFVD